MNSITFQVSSLKAIEPDSFIFGLIIESDDINEISGAIKSIAAPNANIEKVEIENASFTIPENTNDLSAIQVFRVHSRNELIKFTDQLKRITGIRGGIIKPELQEEEKHELELIKELTKLAKTKARQYAELCGRELLGITSFSVINVDKGAWTAYPPVSGLNKQSIYNSILAHYDKKDKFELNRTIEVEFEMK